MPITSADLNSFAGNWNTTWTGGNAGSALVTIEARGPAGTGKFDRKSGTMEGAFSDGDKTFKGTWRQSDASGTFTFILQGSDKFQGTYSFDSGGTGGGEWNGTRAGK